MSDFQRARTDEQRAERRVAILATATAMLQDMTVAEVSLNELSRRTGLAKSNVLRYFESREAILLELLDRTWSDWLDELPARLDSALPDSSLPDSAPPESALPDFTARVDRTAEVLASSLSERRMLCELLSAQAAVLERNVSAEVAARYKRATLSSVAHLAMLIRGPLPELDETAAAQVCGTFVLITGAAWSYSQPTRAMRSAYESHPDLAEAALDFTAAVRTGTALLLTGAVLSAGPPPHASLTGGTRCRS